MIEVMKKLLAKNREWIVYCMIGCTGVALDFAVYAMLTESFGINYQVANFIGVNSGIFNNFFWNCFFNFKTKDKLLVRLTSFYTVGMLGCALSAGCLWLLITWLGVNALLAKTGTIFLVTVVQFSLNKIITFKQTAR